MKDQEENPLLTPQHLRRSNNQEDEALKLVQLVKSLFFFFEISMT